MGAGASGREVRAAFRRYAAIHHPDRGGDPERFRSGLEAYRRLTTGCCPAGGPAAAVDVVFHRRSRRLRPLPGRRSRRRRDLR